VASIGRSPAVSSTSAPPSWLTDDDASLPRFAAAPILRERTVSDADRATALPEGTRRVRDEDAAALIDLIVAAYDEHPGCVLDLPGVDDDLPAPATTAARRGSPWWVVERGGELLASVGVGPLDADGSVELKRLYLAAAARGQGLATRLIDVVERHAAGHGATRVVLWSDTRFADAHHRYAVLGYVRQPETRQLHDPSHTTEYRFEKPITPARPDTTVAWDGPSGRETASVTALPDGRVLTSDLPDLGATVRVEVDGAWATRRAEVTVEGAVSRVLTADGAGTWWLGGEAAPSLAGAAELVGRVIGTEDATPLEFWVAVSPTTSSSSSTTSSRSSAPRPTRQPVHIYGIVSQVRARHEGARFDSRRLPHRGRRAARPRCPRPRQVLTTRFEPEVFVPPLPGQAVRKATGDRPRQALFFDRMERGCRPGCRATTSRSSSTSTSSTAPAARTSTSPACRGWRPRPPTPPSCCTACSLRGARPAATTPRRSSSTSRARTCCSSTTQRQARRHPARPLRPARPASRRRSGRSSCGRRPGGAPPTRRRTRRPGEGVTSFFWTLEEFCRGTAAAVPVRRRRDDRQQYTMVVHNVTAQLKRGRGADRRRRRPHRGRDLPHLPRAGRLVRDRLEDDATAPEWAGRAVGVGTDQRVRPAAVRRAAPPRAPDPRRRPTRSSTASTSTRRRSPWSTSTTSTTARSGSWSAWCCGGVRGQGGVRQPGPAQFVVLDELNKYAPREGTSPIKELLLDVAERGRSLGMILIGAQQTAVRGRAAGGRELGHPGRRPARLRRGVAGRVRLPAHRAASGPPSSSRAR
jgi:uncharacterized protein